jgi:hypothetical protein
MAIILTALRFLAGGLVSAFTAAVDAIVRLIMITPNWVFSHFAAFLVGIIVMGGIHERTDRLAAEAAAAETEARLSVLDGKYQSLLDRALTDLEARAALNASLTQQLTEREVEVQTITEEVIRYVEIMVPSDPVCDLPDSFVSLFNDAAAGRSRTDPGPPAADPAG